MPDPRVGPDDVLIRVAAAGVNFSDLMRRGGAYNPDLPLPHAEGVEAAGTVERVGASVQGPKAGDRVMTMLGQRCQAEHVVAPEGLVFPIPANLSFEAAGALPLAGVTAYHLLETGAAVRPGESVLIHAAASGVGTLAVQLAKLRGARVFATASTDEKLAAVRALGADETINYARENFVTAVLARTDNRGVDVVLECVGGEVLAQSAKALVPGGRLLIYGRASGEPGSLGGDVILTRNLSVLGLHLGRRPWRLEMHREAFVEIVRLAADGRLKPLVDRTFRMRDAAQAHAYLAARRATGKVVLVP
ncbi:MAG: NADPH:quinone oxidoreductase family protein [Candidatus Rokubacteria bacterium]|nr:NADPH:quinone oxidoreductase family protein [Candidatus Rokubacteria bacterium]